MLLKNYKNFFFTFIYIIIFVIIVYLIVKIIYKKYIIENFDFFYKIKPINKPNNWNTLSLGDKIKIYGKNLTKEHSKYVDKLEVKNFIKKLNISDLHIATVNKILNKNDYLDLQNIPKNCIIKTNNGWNDIIIIKNHTIIKMISRGKKLDNNITNYNYWKNNSTSLFNVDKEIQYKYIQPKIFIEQYLGDNLNDYKLYCINGKVQFILIMKDRFSKVCKIYLNRELKPLNINTGGLTCTNTELNISVEKLKRMVEISEKISSIFEFSRIDFYLVQDKIYFGEITFTPKSGNIHITPDSYDKEISKKWV